MDSPEILIGFEFGYESEEDDQPQADRRGKCMCDGSACLVGGGGALTRRRLRALRRVMGEGDATQLATLLLTGCWPDPILEHTIKFVSREDMARAFSTSVPGFFWERGGGATELMCAAREGRAEVVRALLAAGVNVKAEADTNTRLLLYSRAFVVACLKGNVECVEVLLEYGADPRKRLYDNMTPLHKAAGAGKVGSVVALLRWGAEVGATDIRGSTPLHCAAVNGDVPCVRTLLEAGADPNARDRHNTTPLHVACRLYYDGGIAELFGLGRTCILDDADYVECVREMLRRGADVNALNEENLSPLLIAVQEEEFQIANILVENGADLNHRTRDGTTSVHLVARLGTKDSMQEVLRWPGVPHIDDRDEEGNTPLLIAARCGNCYAVETLLLAGADLSARNAEGYTPLHCAVAFGHIDAMFLLLREGADITDVITSNQLTALHLAAKISSESLVELLLENGADINARTADGKTALHFSPSPSHNLCVEKLLELGANPQARDNDGFTVLHCAAEIGSFSCIELLVERGFWLEDRTEDGRTALHVAAGMMHAECVAAMMQRLRAPVNARDHVGRTALHVAARATDEGTVRALLQAGADRLARDAFGDVAADVTENEDIKRLIRRWALAA